jgi:hypothetical protein
VALTICADGQQVSLWQVTADVMVKHAYSLVRTLKLVLDASVRRINRCFGDGHAARSGATICSALEQRKKSVASSTGLESSMISTVRGKADHLPHHGFSL